MLFFKYLKTLYTASDVDGLLKDIMLVCSGNDFIHRVTASQAFTEVSDLSEIDQYIRQQGRVIYLDANVLLYVLCYWFEASKKYENVQYKVVRDLIEFAQHDKNIRLKTSSQYVGEVSFHFKEALLLVPFEQIGFFKNGNSSSSNNVFYKYYLHLKDEFLLEEDVNDFSDFLNKFEISEDLLDNDRQLIQNVSQIVTTILQSLAIDVITIPTYNTESAFNEFKNSLKYLRATEAINNDAKMICYLSDKSTHGIEPIFASWDTVFYDARKKYLGKNKHLQMWHLFTPSKLINHLQLLEFRINAESATNDFLTIIDSFKLKDKTKYTLDAVSELLNINKEERRRYINKLKEFNQKFVFNIDAKADTVEDDTFDQRPVEKLLVELNKHYSQKIKGDGYKSVQLIFSNKDYFDKVISIFETELTHYVKNKDFSADLFVNIDALVKEYKDHKTTSK